MAKKNLTKKQENQAVSKALTTAAKQVESEGVAPLPAGSYPFSINAGIVGELLVGKGTEPGEEITKIDFSISDVLRGLVATLPAAETAISDALAWHKKATKDEKKAVDSAIHDSLLKIGKRRKMVTTVTPSGRAGSVSAKPEVRITGIVATRGITLGVKAS